MSIVLLRPNPVGKDEYGDPLDDDGPTRITLENAFVAPRMSNDIDGRGRDGVVVGLTLYTGYGADVRRTDLVEVDGTEYRIDGDRGDWKQPWTGWEAGSVVALVRAEG